MEKEGCFDNSRIVTVSVCGGWFNDLAVTVWYYDHFSEESRIFSSILAAK